MRDLPAHGKNDPGVLHKYEGDRWPGLKGALAWLRKAARESPPKRTVPSNLKNLKSYRGD